MEAAQVVSLRHLRRQQTGKATMVKQYNNWYQQLVPIGIEGTGCA